jgi:hypothetical protein
VQQFARMDSGSEELAVSRISSSGSAKIVRTSPRFMMRAPKQQMLLTEGVYVGCAHCTRLFVGLIIVSK